MQNPLVSVVIPCYKCEDTIERAISSVIKQTYTNWEIILVEDCSDDNNKTKNKIKELKNIYKEYSIHLFFLDKNGGPSVARNIGMDAANGEYIALLDSDDSWHSSKLFVQINLMLKNKKYSLSSHANEIFYGEEDNINYNKIKCKEISFKEMLFSNRISTRTVMMHKSIKHRFNEDMRYAEDYRLWMEILGTGNKVLYIDENLAYLYKENFGESGLSARLWDMEKGELSTFKYLREIDKINIYIYFATVIWSLMKYGRRLLLVKLKGF